MWEPKEFYNDLNEHLFFYEAFERKHRRQMFFFLHFTQGWE